MTKQEKIVKEFLYDGLGFPIVLENVTFHFIQGMWLPKIDVKKLATLVFRLLPSKSSKLTGNELKFIRIYLKKSKPAFAELFKLSHTAISKWESSGDFPAPISASQEIVLRLHLEDLLKVSHKEFYQTYKGLETAVYLEEDLPLKIAL